MSISDNSATRRGMKHSPPPLTKRKFDLICDLINQENLSAREACEIVGYRASTFLSYAERERLLDPEVIEYMRMFNLTVREAEVVRLTCKAWRNQEIADALSIKLNTVKGHLKNVFEKAQVKSRVNLMLRIHLIRQAEKRVS